MYLDLEKGRALYAQRRKEGIRGRRRHPKAEGWWSEWVNQTDEKQEHGGAEGHEGSRERRRREVLV